MTRAFIVNICVYWSKRELIKCASNHHGNRNFALVWAFKRKYETPVKLQYFCAAPFYVQN